jgi:hypothetical protein
MTINDVDDAPFDFDAGPIEIGRYARMSADGFEIAIDGAVGYSVRLIPSNKVLGRFESTHEAWPVILAEVDRGIPARCIVLDWHGLNGQGGRIGGGQVLVFIARAGMGRSVTAARTAS